MKRLLALQVPFLLLAAQIACAVVAPNGLIGLAGDQSIALHWNKNADANLVGYRVYRSTVGPSGPFNLLNTNLLAAPGYCDLSSAVVNGQTNFYLATAVDASSVESAPSAFAVGAVPHPFASDNEFLDYVQETSFDYFWYLANPVNGLIPDRSASDSPCSIAAQGFGLTAICIGVDHGWITRAAAAQRVLAALNTFYNGPQGPGASGIIGYKGWFYHFLDMNTAARSGSSELSSVDTVWLLAGILDAQQYFNGTNAAETAIRSTGDAIVNRVDWTFMSQGTAGVAMGWQPGTGFSGFGNWVGYNEAAMLYCLGLGAATNPLPTGAWSVWTGGYQWQTNYGQSYLSFAPLFGHQYTHCWVDFRHIGDAYMNGHSTTYFENSRRATLSHVAYCSTSPKTGYSSNVWGLTACDGPPPAGYAARGIPPAAPDDGTIAPTAAGASICFTPENSIPALKTFYNNFRTNIWTENGFRDAFNLGLNWYDPDELGIDQGPIVIMIENYRTQRVWQRFMKSAVFQRGLPRAGFVKLPYTALAIQPVPAQSAYKVSWVRSNSNRSYQVEYSPDLFTWEASPGFTPATSTGTLSWLDNGPPLTDFAPASTPQRFYRVFQLGPP